MKVVHLRRGVTLREMVPHAHHEGGEQAAEGNSGRDPHIWLSPTLLKIQARTVAETLSEIDPENRGQYASNLEQLEKELDQADKAIRQTLAPFKGRRVFRLPSGVGILCRRLRAARGGHRDGRETADRS